MFRYLTYFEFMGRERESKFFQELKYTCYNNFYPFGVLKEEITEIDFEPITIIYGGNGSGKSTILNIIAEKLNINRTTKFNKSSFFHEYIRKCSFEFDKRPPVSKIITSDDVFKNLFLLREKNEIIDKEREDAFEKIATTDTARPESMREYMGGLNWLDNYDRLQEYLDISKVHARKKSQSKFVKERVEENLIGKSNGETALSFFVDEIKDKGLYLLDEPENSLSASFQIELAKFLYDSARFFGAQLIIATHSPFILSIPDAKIYNLDSEPVSYTYDWSTLENMRVYYDFFKNYKMLFEK